LRNWRDGGYKGRSWRDEARGKRRRRDDMRFIIIVKGFKIYYVIK
jgi:hypothetical protein